MASVKKIISGTVLGLATLSMVGCGSSGSGDDQGTSFTLYNFYRDAICTQTLPGVISTISQDVENPDSSTGGNGAGPIAYAGVQNNLASQTLRLRQALYTFYVDGADVQPPATTSPTGVVLGAANSLPGGSLPPSLGGDGEAEVSPVTNTGCVGFQIVPTDILSYVSLNRSKFPELPFTMRVQVAFRGIASSGNEIDSNPLDFFVQFTEDNIITPPVPTDGDGSDTTATDNSGEGTGLDGDTSTTTDEDTQL